MHKGDVCGSHTNLASAVVRISSQHLWASQRYLFFEVRVFRCLEERLSVFHYCLVIFFWPFVIIGLFSESFRIYVGVTDKA